MIYIASAVSKTTLYSDVWQNVFDLINQKVGDPLGRGTKWIFSSFPMKMIDDVNSYPLIIIEHADVPSTIIHTLGDEIRTKTITVAVSIYCTSYKRGDILIEGNKQLDELSSAVRVAVEDNNYYQFFMYPVTGPSPTSSSGNWTDDLVIGKLWSYADNHDRQITIGEMSSISGSNENILSPEDVIKAVYNTYK